MQKNLSIRNIFCNFALKFIVLYGKGQKKSRRKHRSVGPA